MPDFSLELARRNARLRAFRAVGVPISGGWERAPEGYRIALFCDACGYFASEKLWPRFRARLEWQESLMLRGLDPYGMGPCCAHLGPLLDGDPAEVVEITALELLAG